MRIGHGYDVHKLVYGRKLILGGVEVPFEKGLLGHSDADVLTHAIIDALLGSAGLGDIGQHFPNTKEEFKNICSQTLLARVYCIIIEKNYYISNIDCTIICQAPQLAPYLLKMAETLAQTLNIPKNKINLKATTEEGLGFTGSGEAIAVHAVCLLTA
jgi:2-C-methyl-D-erythritol 2,4-cyclodiphosphate synthase